MIVDYEPPITVASVRRHAVVYVHDDAYYQAMLGRQDIEFDTADEGRGFALFCHCDQGPHWSVWVTAERREPVDPDRREDGNDNGQDADNGEPPPIDTGGKKDWH